MKSNLRRGRGFTLIEMIIVIVVIGIMAAVLSPLALSSLRAYDTTLNDLLVLDKLRYATERLAREVREVDAGFVFTPTTGMGANSMEFTRHYYDSSGAAGSATVVRVCNNGAEVRLGYSATSTSCSYTEPILTDELNGSGNAGLQFRYFKSDGVTPATGSTDVGIIEISLTLSHNGNTYPQVTRVELKNK